MSMRTYCSMKICWIFLQVLFAPSIFGQTPARPRGLPVPRVLTLTAFPETVTVVYLHPGYVSAVRVPEDVSSVVLGNPKEFAAEHSEAEPRLVFIKPVLTRPGETNVLITTKAGHEIPLHLISNGDSQVDFLLDFQVARASFMIPSTLPSFTVAETTAIGSPDVAPGSAPSEASATAETALLKATRVSTPKWEGKQLKVAVGQVSESGHRTVVSFSALNNSASTIELLPPQVQLAGRAKQKGPKAKADQVPIDAYGLTQRRLGPGQRADGVLLFERPSFKESSEQLFLQVAQAEAVDRPVLVPIAFTAPKEGGTR